MLFGVKSAIDLFRAFVYLLGRQQLGRAIIFFLLQKDQFLHTCSTCSELLFKRKYQAITFKKYIQECPGDAHQSISQEASPRRNLLLKPIFFSRGAAIPSQPSLCVFSVRKEFYVYYGKYCMVSITRGIFTQMDIFYVFSFPSIFLV